MASGKVSRLIGAAAILGAIVPGGTAMASGPGPDKMACIAADTDGQSLRMTGSLVKARRRFAVCASTNCPSVVRDDCLERIAEVEAAQPEVVFTATNGAGRPVVSVHVTVDGVPIADRLDGRPLRVDPGDHEFVFESLGRVTAKMKVTLREGDKHVRHAVVLRTGSGDPVDEVPAPEPLPVADDAGAAAPTESPPAANAAAPPAPTTVGDRFSSRRIAAIAVGSAGALGVVLGSVFGALTIKTWSDATADCRNNVCPAGAAGESDQRQARAAAWDGDVSTAAFIAGGLGLALGAWLWFAPVESSSPSSGVSVLPVAGPSQGQLLVRGRF
jgi:hypothetical protein